VPDHIFRNVNGHVPAAIVHSDGMAHHLGEDGAGPAPGADDLLLATLVHNFDPIEQLWFDKGSFFQ
jgi:hypothetical protein